MSDRSVLALLLVFATLTPTVPASDHVVELGELHQHYASDDQRRQSDIAVVQHLLESPVADGALEPVGLNAEEVKRAVPLLDDETLAELAVKARSIEDDVAGGLVGSLILLLVLAIALVVLVTVTSE